MTYQSLSQSQPLKLKKSKSRSGSGKNKDKGKDKIHCVQGVDTPITTREKDKDDEASTWAWKWRGSGWLKVASSKWEVLGYGTITILIPGPTEDKSGHADGNGEEERVEWMVTYFSRTLFTPAGIDIYARPRAVVPEELLAGIKRGLKDTADVVLGRLAEELFPVRHDSNSTSIGSF